MFTIGSLHLDYGTMLVQLIAFLVLLGLVIKYAMKPAMKVMNERQSYIDNQISSAEEARKEAAGLVEEQRKVLNDTKKEAYELIESAKVQKNREAEEIMKAAQERAERTIQDAVAEIENEKNKAIAALRSQVSAMSVMIASKIIEKQIDEKSQEELINNYLKEVGENL